MGYDTPLTPTDPAAVDFRAFYPYTPNEVKHRKRTTSAQLKVLEDIFKKDTKPNATLRTELAAELDMTPRGVQVWFQNRRAKEKVKASKASMAAKANAAGLVAGRQDEASALRNVKNESLHGDSLLGDGSQDPSDAFSRSPSNASRSPASLATSPPTLHLITDAANFPSYSAADLPPDSAASYASSRPALQSSRTAPVASLNQRFGHGVGGDDLYQYRRGSLPVNAFPQPQQSAEDDAFDPFVRRRSVDASLQRLAANPFAGLARAKNSALYGPGVGVAQPGTTSNGLGAGMGAGVGRHHHVNRLPYGYQSQRRGVSSLSSASPAGHLASMPQYTGLRRSSMDSRSMRLSQLSRSYQTPSPSPLTPYNAVIRASLPDSHLYAVSQRPVASPIPGPLPSPGFSFGAASSNTPSMASPSSGDSERNSPDSLRSFTFRGDETEQDDDATSPSYTAYSRFGSIASIATSESSVNSSYYAEIGGAAVEHAHLEDRRDSCASGNFLGMLSGLDVGNQVEHMGHAGSMGLGIGAAVGYPPTHEEYTFSASAGEGLELVSGSVTDGHLHQQQSADQQQQEQYPSPASTIAPNSNGQSPQPRAQDPPSANVPISTSSELAFALEGKPGQSSGTASPPETYVNYGEHSPPEQLQHETSYFPQQLEHQPQDANASFSQTYSFPNGSQQQQPQLDYGVFSSSGSFVDPLATGGVMDNGLQSVEAFVAYT